MNFCGGTMVERGEIVDMDDMGGYIVESYDRAGYRTDYIRTIVQGGHMLGDTVIYAGFDDGTGIILAALPD